MGFGGGGSGSFVLPDHTHSSVADDGGALERLVSKVDADLLEKFPNLQLLDSHRAGGVESSYTYTPSPALDLDAKYDEIIVIAKGKTTASLAILLKINSQTEYHTTLTSNTLGTITGIHNGSAVNVELISNSILNSGRGFNSNIHISKELSNTTSISLSYYGFANASTRAVQTFAGGSIAITTPEITSLQIFTSTSTWIAGTTINTYGVLK